MSRLGYWAIVLVFGASAVGGAALFTPTPGELGLVDHEMTCAEWFAHEGPAPTGHVRLTDCALDGTRWGIRGGHWGVGGTSAAGVEVEPADPDAPRAHEPTGYGGEVVPRRLGLSTRDPSLRRLADTYVQHDGEAARARFRARHAAELRPVRDLEGELVRVPPAIADAEVVEALALDQQPGPAWTLRPARRSTGRRATGVSFFVLGVLGLLILIPAQRRWKRRREELCGGTDRPLTF
ncbi:MAG TPA: hypothetical protein RMH99_08980 [Sandaracinaceae bacterium LLY-WYZ-13_1]|nr:hypothetical protein [Sandaracinaceae bacterium LLY-WYZ-13_1]